MADRKWYVEGGGEDYDSWEQTIDANQTNYHVGLGWRAERIVLRTTQEITVKFYDQQHKPITVAANGVLDTDYLWTNFKDLYITTGASAAVVKIIAGKQEY